MISRRHFGRCCAAAVLLGRRFLRAAGRIPLTWTAQPDAHNGRERRYRADAQVIALGITLLHRRNVGDGSAAWRESAAPDGGMIRMLEFSGRSAPERAAGLNRFGFIEELSRNQEAIYFGLMTSSPEDSAGEARKALDSNAKDAWYSAIDGHITTEGIDTGRVHFLASARTTLADRQELIERARRELSGTPRIRSGAGGASQPFLHALAGLLSDPSKKEALCAYNGNLYQIAVERSPDPKAAVQFREVGAISPTAGAVRVSGTLRRRSGGKPIEFRLWIEENASRPLPLRIEYQAKSYLRLTFEAET